jgi:hypothetical protein
VLEFRGSNKLSEGAAFVIPPDEPWRLTDASRELRLLHVTTARLD